MALPDRLLRANLRLRHLQLLVALDELRHLGRAADALSLTQPAVSKALAEIERLIGLPLFVRSTRGTEPTDYGQVVIRFARSVLADYDRTRDELAAVASGAAGRVSLGVMVAATPGLLADAVDRLKARSRLTTVAVEEGDLTRLLPRLRAGEHDLIVGRLEPGYAAPDLATETLMEMPMRLVARADHPLHAGALAELDGAAAGHKASSAAKAAWAALAREPWVMPPAWATSRIKLHALFYRHGVDPPTDVIETAAYLAMLTFVRDRGAVAFVAEDVATQLAREGLARPLPVAMSIALPPVGLMTLRQRRLTPAAEQMRQALREAAAARRPVRSPARVKARRERIGRGRGQV